MDDIENTLNCEFRKHIWREYEDLRKEVVYGIEIAMQHAFACIQNPIEVNEQFKANVTEGFNKANSIIELKCEKLQEGMKALQFRIENEIKKALEV